MPRKQILRRFDPRFGVSMSMVEAEAVHVDQEFRDYLIMSINDLRRWLRERSSQVEVADKELEQLVTRLPDRERLAIRCMLIRDIFHIAKLYQQLLRTPEAEVAAGPISVFPEELKNHEPLPVLPFREWLFD